MQVTKEQNETIKRHFEKMDSMGYDEIIEFERKVFMAKPNLDSVVFDYLLMGIDVVKKHIEYAQQNSMVVDGELVEGEL